MKKIYLILFICVAFLGAKAATYTINIVGNTYSPATLTVNVGDVIKADQALTTNPNVGGFGQEETEIVLQNPSRIQGLLVFFLFVLLAQVFLVLKKKQFEKVQLAEMNF